MKSAKLLLLVLGLALFTHCSKDSSNDPIDSKPDDHSQEEPQPEEETETIYFTFTEGEDKDTSASDNWVIINRPDGSFLDYKPFESGQTLEFKAKESEVPEIFMVSLLSSRQTDLGTTADLNVRCNGTMNSGITYPNIQKGSVWKESNYATRLSPSPKPENLGSFTFTVLLPNGLDIANNYFYDLGTANSGNLSTLRLPELGSGMSEYDYEGKTAMDIKGVNNWQDTSYLISILDGDNSLKYFFFTNPEQGSDLTVDYSNFKDYDSYGHLPVIPAANENYTVQMLGFENETDFRTHTGYFILEMHDRPYGQIPLGYLDRFSLYKTSVEIRYPNANYSYRLLGGKTALDHFPEVPMLHKSGTNMTDFALETETPYVRRNDAWHSTAPVTESACQATAWQMITETTHYSAIVQLPDALLEHLPTLDPMDGLEYSSSTIYLKAFQNDYQEFIANTFDPNYDHIIKPGMEEEYFKITQ